MSSELSLGSSNALVNQGKEMEEELDYIEKTIKEIYKTFDELKTSWTGQKSEEYKAILEEARIPLETLCKSCRMKNEAISNVGKILSDYRNQG